MHLPTVEEIPKHHVYLTLEKIFIFNTNHLVNENGKFIFVFTCIPLIMIKGDHVFTYLFHFFTYLFITDIIFSIMPKT